MDELDEFLSRRRRNPKQMEFFNSRADQWDSTSSHDPEKVRHIVSLLGIRDGMRILDVGTGTGVMIPYYMEGMEGGHITALDYSERMIEVARSKFPESERLSFRVQDLYDIRDSGAYDLVVCYSCFPHFPDPVSAIRILSWSLVPGGRLCIAHSSSREHINTIHREGGEAICADYLPDAGLMARMMSMNGLETELEVDDDEYYIVTGRRPIS